MAMLKNIWQGSLKAENPPLILIAESIWQSSLPIIRSLIEDALSRQETIYALSLLQPPSVAFSNLKGLNILKDVMDIPENITDKSLIVIHGIHSRPLAEQVNIIRHIITSKAKPSRLIVSYNWNLDEYDILKSLTTSSSTAHIHPLPRELVLYLHENMSVPLPTVDDDAKVNSNLPAMVTTYASRNWGNPFDFPNTIYEEDNRVSLNQLSSANGSCLVLLSCHGISASTPSDSNRRSSQASSSEPSAAINWTLEGLKCDPNGHIQPCSYGSVIQLKPASSRLTEAQNDSKANPSVLPFNLSLTQQQAEVRSNVPLPFYDSVSGSGPTVTYFPDAADDLDGEDPDEDLEI